MRMNTLIFTVLPGAQAAWAPDASGLTVELPTGRRNDCAFVSRIRQ
jgi:hypothetical protein